MDCDVLIIGAGAAGLAVAAGLSRKGLKPVILERGERAGWSWIHRYDRLHLHTAKGNSALPFKAFPAAYPKYMHRDQLVAYYQDYVREFGIDIRFGHSVERIEDTGAGWRASGSDWTFEAPTLVMATGYSHTPVIPEIDGLYGFGGDVRHSSDYREASGYKGKRVLVIGMGNSGAEIALDLAENDARPTLSVRGPVLIIPREIFGISADTIAIKTRRTPPRIADRLNKPVRRFLIGNYQNTGLTAPDYGPMTMISERRKIPVIDVGTLEKLRAGEIAVKPGIERVDGHAVLFTDNSTSEFDAIIFGTGFSTGLTPLLGAIDEVLDGNGKPLVSGAESAQRGLYFCGYNVTAGGMLREIRNEAAGLCEQIAQNSTPTPASVPA